VHALLLLNKLVNLLHEAVQLVTACARINQTAVD